MRKCEREERAEKWKYSEAWGVNCVNDLRG